MDTFQDYEIMRADLHREVDEVVDRAIARAKANPGAAQIAAAPAAAQYESIYPLTTDTGVFRGKRPTDVIFQDGHRETVTTWKSVFQVIMKECNSDSEKHRLLMELRGRIKGRNRTLLDSGTDHMRSPVQIDEDLYAETHYDTQTLLRVLTTRILKRVRYDYTGIKIVVEKD